MSVHFENEKVLVTRRQMRSSTDDLTHEPGRCEVGNCHEIWLRLQLEHYEISEAVVVTVIKQNCIPTLKIKGMGPLYLYRLVRQTLDQAVGCCTMSHVEPCIVYQEPVLRLGSVQDIWHEMYKTGYFVPMSYVEKLVKERKVLSLKERGEGTLILYSQACHAVEEAAGAVTKCGIEFEDMDDGRNCELGSLHNIWARMAYNGYDISENL